MSDQEHKGIIDQISDFGSKFLGKVKDGLGFSHHENKEKILDPLPMKDNTVTVPKYKVPEKTIEGIFHEGHKLDPDDPMAKFVNIELGETKHPKDIPKTLNPHKIEKFSYQGVSYDEKPKEEEIFEMENQNRGIPKVKEYAFNPKLHQEKHDKKLKAAKDARTLVGKVKEVSTLNLEGNTRNNDDDLFVETNRKQI